MGANLDELDYLARRLDSFDGYEAAQFQAAAVRLGISDMTGFINLTFCCQQATVITDFSDLDAVGRRHYMTLEGGCTSAEELENVDGVETALLLISDNEGSVTPYGVLYDNGMELEQLYREGGPFPGYADREYSMLLEASAGEGQSTLLLLPDSQARLERLLGRAGIQYSSQVRFRVVDSTLPGAVFTRCGWSGARARRPCSGCEKTAGYYGHTVVCCVLTKRGERAMNYQRRQDMCRDPVEGRLPFWESAFTLAAK